MTLRSRLMLLYAVPFFVVGAVLVTWPMLGASRSAPVGSGPEPHPVETTVQFPFATWTLTLATLVLASVVLGWVVAGRFLRPLQTMTETARDISANNLHRRLGVTGRRDELAELAGTLDQLFVRLEASFVSQRHFVANASHELRTPLTAERTLLQVALADPDASAESLRAACEEVLALSAIQERLIEALLTLASGQHGVERQERFDLAEVATAVLASHSDAPTERSDRHDWAERSDRVSVRSTLAPAPAEGDPHLVGSLVTNLVDNALRHNVAGGTVEVSTSVVEGGARLVVRNTGPVIPPTELDRLFEPFQRLAGRRIWHGEGHGLGLAIVRAIADVHGAALEAHTRPEGGLDITITFPAHAFARR